MSTTTVTPAAIGRLNARLTTTDQADPNDPDWTLVEVTVDGDYRATVPIDGTGLDLRLDNLIVKVVDRSDDADGARGEFRLSIDAAPVVVRALTAALEAAKGADA